MEGHTVSHYQIFEKLGGGGMGVVYRALDGRLNRTVALKFLPPDLTRDDEARERFVHEAQAASALDHPNICTIYEIDTTPDGRMFLALAYYEGETVKKRIDRGPLSVAEALDIAMQVAQGLVKAHESGIVHRDIKPANLMLTKDGTVKILDFGIAKLSGVTGLTRTGVAVGTVSYMAPEQLKGGTVDHRVDVWALGVVLYEMLTGVNPFHRDHESGVINAILNEEPRRLTDLRAGVPHRVGHVVARALDKDAGGRYATAAELRDDLARCRAALTAPVTAVDVAGVWQGFRTSWIAWTALFVLVAAVIAGAFAWSRGAEARRARAVTIPEIRRLIEQDRLLEAYALAEQVERIIPQEAALGELWPRMSVTVSVETTPPNADVFVSPYSAEDRERTSIGRTPLTRIRLPQGAFRIRARADGYEPIDTVELFTGRNPVTLRYTLPKTGSVPAGMVAVPGGPLGIDFVVLSATYPPIVAPAYFIDRSEVSNEAFKAFVDQGGYRSRSLWKHPFERAGRVVSWEEGVATFTDETGRPGPSTWAVGTFPDQQQKYPVSGVSWYEAAAYCESVGKALPTIYHWSQAASVYWSQYISSQSNFSGKGPAPVGTTRSLSRSGTYDMAGNVKEWAWNSSGQERYLLGGAWSDPDYKFFEPETRSPFDRSPSNGFRCAQYQSDTVPAGLAGNIPLPTRDYAREQPVPDQLFEAYKSLYLYDKTNLNAVVEGTDDSPPNWRRERITFDAAYGDERVIAHLFLPKTGSPPYQTVVVFPLWTGSSKISSERLPPIVVPEFLLVGGRAVMVPIYQGTYERSKGDLSTGYPRNDRLYRNYAIHWVQDLMRSIDYLETRSDIDLSKLAFHGTSWGGPQGAIVPAVEPRLAAGVLVLAGLPMQRSLPEVDPINFVGRVRIPMLILGGQYDFVFPLEASQRPMFTRLGTPPADKRLRIFDGVGHDLSTLGRNDVIRETLVWLDKYLGRVE